MIEEQSDKRLSHIYLKNLEIFKKKILILESKSRLETTIKIKNNLQQKIIELRNNIASLREINKEKRNYMKEIKIDIEVDTKNNENLHHTLRAKIYDLLFLKVFELDHYNPFYYFYKREKEDQKKLLVKDFENKV